MINNKDLLLKLYVRGDILADIAKRFGVSRQRIWQIVKTKYQNLDLSNRIEANGKSMNPRPEERYVYDLLVRRGGKPKFQNYNSPNDLVMGRKKIQIKYRTHSEPVRKGKYTNYYFRFPYLIEREKPDYYVFLCGSLLDNTSYVVPANKITGNFKQIPEMPLNKNTKRFSRLYKNNWKLLF